MKDKGIKAYFAKRDQKAQEKEAQKAQKAQKIQEKEALKEKRRIIEARREKDAQEQEEAVEHLRAKIKVDVTEKKRRGLLEEHEKYTPMKMSTYHAAKKARAANAPAVTTCKVCQGVVSKEAPTCPHCGQNFPGENVTCPFCQSTRIAQDKQGFGFGKAAAGAVLLGPVGLAAGAINRNKTVLLCQDCGRKWSKS